MYLGFYGLREDPFNETADSDFLYQGLAYRSAVDSLIRGIENGIVLQALVGPAGMGKTTVLRAVRNHFAASARTAFLFQTQCSPLEFLNYVLLKLEDEAGFSEIERAEAKLIDLLQQEKSRHRAVLLLIDEAHNLELSVLKILQFLAQTQVGSDVMRIVLAGLPGFTETIKSAELPSFHTGSICEMAPLSKDEVPSCVQHRLSTCGYSGRELFTQEAFRLIAEHSRGVPRSVNMLCFHALSLGHRQQKTVIDVDMVEEAIAQRDSVLHSLVQASTPALGLAAVEAEESRPSEVEDGVERNGATAGPDSIAAQVQVWFAQANRVTWTGTATELLSELENRAPVEININPDKLRCALEGNAELLSRYGIEVLLRNQPGFPRFLVIRRSHALYLHNNPEQVEPNVRASNGNATTSLATDATSAEEAATKAVSVDQESDSATDQLMSSPEKPAAAEVSEAQLLTESESERQGATNVANSTELPSFDCSQRENAASAYKIPASLVLVLLVLGVVVLAPWGSKLSPSRQSGSQSAAPLPAQANSTVKGEVKGESEAARIPEIVRKAGDGDVAAQLLLGSMHENGDGLKKSDSEAAKWFRSAAEQGDTTAAYRLGNCYAQGRGVQQSNVDAYTWYVLASSGGNTMSEEAIRVLTPKLSGSEIAKVRFNLGQLYANGIGAARDLVAAYSWFTLAQVAGSTQAQQAKVEIEANMTDIQIAEARNRAAQWLRTHSLGQNTELSRRTAEQTSFAGIQPQ